MQQIDHQARTEGTNASNSAEMIRTRLRTRPVPRAYSCAVVPRLAVDMDIHG